MLRSILAILAGLTVIVVTSFGIEAAVTPLLMLRFSNEAALSHHAGVWIFTFTYTFFCVVAGGYVAARIATRLPVRHAISLGVLQSALTIPAMLAFPDKAPLWGWICSMIVVIPAAWFGGLIHQRKAIA